MLKDQRMRRWTRWGWSAFQNLWLFFIYCWVCLYCPVIAKIAGWIFLGHMSDSRVNLSWAHITFFLQSAQSNNISWHGGGLVTLPEWFSSYFCVLLKPLHMFTINQSVFHLETFWAYILVNGGIVCFAVDRSLLSCWIDCMQIKERIYR